MTTVSPSRTRTRRPAWRRIRRPGAAAVAGLLAGALALPGAARADTPAGVSVEGNQLLKDGAPFLPRGFNLVGLLTPDWCSVTATAGARAHFGQAEMDAAKAWDATMLRFQVSQRGLADPTVPQADRDAYLQEVEAGVELARTNGFVVVLSMQDQRNGCGPAHPLPTAQTVAAWDVLAPAFVSDPDVLFELFNEPANAADAAGWAQWRDGGSAPLANLGDPAVGHQELVDDLRALGSTNVLVADVASHAEQSAGLPLLTDPLGELVYGIHPYYYTGGPAWWDKQYGALAARAPVLATEWNFLAGGCGGPPETLAPSLLDYLRDHGIGVLGHAFDQVRTTIADWTWAPTACGSAVPGSGQILQGFFAGLVDRESPPTRPTGLLATAVAPYEVDLAWTASTDDVGVAGYRVLRDGTLLGETADPAWSDTTARPATGYTYAVQAFDAGDGASPLSDPLSVTTPAAPPDVTAPSTPAAFTVRVVSPTRVALSWTASTDDVGVTGYLVQRDGVPLATVTGPAATDTTPPAGPHTYQVTAFDAAGNPSVPATAAVTVPAPAPSGLTGTYFDTATLTVPKLTRIDRTVNFDWGTRSPATGIGRETFSVRWTGRLLVPAGGVWTLYAQSDQGMRVWVDGAVVIDDWTAHTLRERSATVSLTADRAHDLRIEYYDKTGTATARLLWKGPGTGKQVIPAAQLLAR